MRIQRDSGAIHLHEKLVLLYVSASRSDESLIDFVFVYMILCH